MKADLTRNTFDPRKHFTRVLMQQGRVQLDADWNEQAAILLRYLQALAADLIGPHGGPTANLGFRIADSNPATDFAISPGHYYVDGILCELASPSVPVPLSQPNQPNQPNGFMIPPSSIASFKENRPVLLCAEGQSPLLTTIQSVGSDGSVTVTASDGPAVSNVLSASNPHAYCKFITFLTQPDYPPSQGTTVTQGSSLIYLDVWERLVTYVEDDSIREVALNGADTAARSKLVCQVKQMSNQSKCIAADNLKSQFQPPNRGRLMAQAKQTSTSTDPCVIAPDASYRGPENQLYRVEIHTGAGNDLTPTFKWSRENGSKIFSIVSLPTSPNPAGGANTTTVLLENLGRDDRFGLTEGSWVEILDDNYVLQNTAGTLLQVESINSGNLTVTLVGTPPTNLDLTKHPLMRGWDQTFGDPAQGGLQMGHDDAALTMDGTWLSLEDGIQIQFQSAAQGSTNLYRTGDYWLIPARTATGDIEWPTGTDGALALPPDGVDHHYAPLAVINVTGSGVVVEVLCQHQFPELTSLESQP
jgi:Family of unknown function (DUF6519)